jgi:hypothetical protein
MLRPLMPQYKRPDTPEFFVAVLEFKFVIPTEAAFRTTRDLLLLLLGTANNTH